jgi:hypothetical protein
MVTTDEVLAVVARSPYNFGSERPQWLRDEMAKLGATEAEMVAAVLPALDSSDRNLRVRALWALSLFADARATEGVLRGLRDPARRVREVAMKASVPQHVASPEVVAALQRIAEDETETNRLRRHAFFALSSGATRSALPDVAGPALLELMGSDRYRLPILVRLCKSRSRTPETRAILQEFVRSGTKDEAVMATRALAGQILVRVDAWLPADVRRRVRETYDPAPSIRGTTFGEGAVDAYWLPIADAVELAASMGYPHVP